MPEKDDPLIELKGVGHYYRLGHTRIQSLEDISLCINRGELAAFFGPSGSGKSTLCNIIGAIDLPASGSAVVAGRDLATLSDDARAEHRNRTVGFVFQQFNLLPVLSARENIMLPLLLRGERRRTAEDGANNLLEELGIASLGGNRPDRLSGGERQRVAVARALIGNPSIIIADEPTANLDTDNAMRIVRLIHDLNTTHNVTFILATHDQRLLRQAKRIISMKDGRVVEDMQAVPE